MKIPQWVMLLALAMTVAVYAVGLNGPFLFDDHIHITQNQWVKIESLAWPDLVRAWNSSFSAFPANRPLAQLTFGINHAISGLDPWVFKATNLAIHLFSGVLIFIFVRLALHAVRGRNDPSTDICAAVAAAFWLLHPLNVSTVLYTVQRMAQLSNLSLLMALTAYFWGRLQIADGKGGRGWIVAAAPIAMLGFLGKENTVLLPLLLLVSELTLLRSVSPGESRGFLRGVWAVFIALPLLAGLVYLLTHPGLLGYQSRPFTLDERVLTQPRVLWTYLRWLFIPDSSAFGLFHDDIEISTGLTSPLSTIIAILGLLALLGTAFTYRRKAPVFAFAVLFFLANHALESTVFPLEMVFEHRNYLASVGPLMLLAYLITITSRLTTARPLVLVVGGLLLVSYTVVTAMRVSNWSSYERFIFRSVETHPDSPRSNFMAGQLIISVIANSEGDVTDLYNSGRVFMQRGIELDSRCINCLFGLIVLDLHVGKTPDQASIDKLSHALRSGHVGPTRVSVSQFSYLVRWQQGERAAKLTAETMEEMFDAALENPGWNSTARASIEAAYREYWHHVAKDLPRALKHGRAAVRAWPSQWSYQFAVAKLLHQLDRPQEALAVLDKAVEFADNEKKQRETAELRANLRQVIDVLEQP